MGGGPTRSEPEGSQRTRDAAAQRGRAGRVAPPQPSSPTLCFLGGTGTVTGSRFLLDTPRARVLLDCGLFQGLRELRRRNWAPFPVPAASIDAVLLSHAHVDHSGYLPALARAGFGGPIFASEGTRELAEIVLPDSGRLQEEDAAYANRKGFSKHRPALPLYTEADAEAVLGQLRSMAWSQPVEVAEGVRARIEPAGHILGAAIVELLIDDAPPRRLVLSGDLGRPSHPLLVPPKTCPAADALLVESTYGDREHVTEDAPLELAELISRTAARGGIVLIPAFAVDRTEVVLFHLRELVRAGRIPSLPVYVDSPMACAALAVYRRAIARGSPEIRPELRDVADPFDPGKLVEACDLEESIAIHDVDEPAIVVSASGMATGGRVLHHLARRLPDARHSVALVGFQAQGTRGRRLLDGERAVKMLGRYVPVRAEIVDLGGFSVHADRSEILAWLRTTEAAPGTAFVVHGEPTASAALRDAIDTELGWSAVVPEHGERVRL